MAYYYTKDSIIPVDEDSQYELKAHRNFSSDEIPAWRADGTKICPTRAIAEYYKLKNANRTRQPISRNICGFLNSGNGGTIMIGVLDSGKVVGIPLSSLQKDHLILSLEDALRRFKPRVPNEFVKVAFIPVVDNDFLASLLTKPSKCKPPNDVRRQPHQFRTSSLCWCDHQAMNRLKNTYMSMYYVVEVRVAALHPNLRTSEVSHALAKFMRNEVSPLVRLSWPAFTSEDGNLFHRIQNCLIKYTKEDITKFINKQTRCFVLDELNHMEKGHDYDAARHQHLQSLMPDGVIVSSTYFRSILDHAEFSSPDFNPKPLPKSDDEESESNEKQNSLSPLNTVNKEITSLLLDLVPLNDELQTPAEPANETSSAQTTKDQASVASISDDQDTSEKTNDSEGDKTNKVEDVPALTPEEVSVKTVIGTTLFVDDLLQID